jgi:hypothetical protein
LTGVGAAIAKHARESDQLIVNAQMQAGNYERGGRTVSGCSYIAHGLRFGVRAKANREASIISVRAERPSKMRRGTATNLYPG